MDLDYSRMCRLCMSKDNVNIYIFCQNSLSETISETINNCLPVKIDINDSFPHKICEECFGKVDMISRFRDIVRDTNDKFNSLLSQGYFTTCSSDISKNDYKQMTPATAVYIVNQTNDPHSNDAVSVIQENDDPNIIQHDQNTFRIVHDLHFRNTENIIEEDSSNDIIESDCSDSDKKSIMNNSQTDKFSSDLSDTSFATTNIRSTDFELGLGLRNENTSPYLQTIATSENTQECQTVYFGETFVDVRQLFNMKSCQRQFIHQENFDTAEVISNITTPVLAPLLPVKTILDENISESVECELVEENKPMILQEDKEIPIVETSIKISTNKHVCEHCEMEFVSYVKLSYHLKAVHEERKFKCEICHRKFITAHHLKMHSSMHSDVKPFPCDKCSSTFIYKKLLDSHKLSKHVVMSDDLSLPFACSMCEMKFSSRNLYNHHAKSHRGKGKGPFPCDICGKELATKESLSCHKIIHTGEKTLVCEVCNKSFSHRKYYVVHKRIHTGERPYICSTCGKSFTQASTLTVHRRYHTGERPYVCTICDKGFVTRTIMSTHMKKHTEGSKKYLKVTQGEIPSAAAKLKLLNVQPIRKQAVVPQGLKELSAKLLKTNVVIKKITPLAKDNTEDNDPTYYNSSGDYGSTSDEEMLDFEVLDEDPSEDYKPSTSKPKKKTKEKYIKARQPRKPRKAKMVEIKTSSAFVCMTCTDRFSSYLELKDHMKTSDHCRSFNLTCEVCSKTFLTKKAMYQHAMTHREKTIFICEECGKTYTNRFSLENHKATVHGDQIEELGSVYKCKACDNTFVNRRELYAHVNQHTKEQVHLCDTCGKCFSTVDNLRSHLRIHSDVRPFPCDSCEKKFKTRLALVQHSHRHTGIKPYICDICGKTFAKRGSLSSHVRNHNGDVTVYQCHICREQFRSSAKLNTHIKFHPQF